MTHEDRLAALLSHFRVDTGLFHTGPLCGTTVFPAEPGRGFLHVLRRGGMELTHPDGDGGLTRVVLDEPALLFYPRPLRHTFHTPLVEGADFTCAAVDFEGGTTHPIAAALPPVLLIPLDDVPNLAPALDLLFSEVDNVRCGHRLVANRLFEVVLIGLLRWILDHTADLDVPAGLFAGLADADLAPLLIALHEGPGGNWSLTTMAQRAQMSRSAFAAHFKAVMGMPPGEYLTLWRLTIAQQRLNDGAAVAEVARQLGYGSASSFSRVFTQRMGASPREWRKCTLGARRPERIS